MSQEVADTWIIVVKLKARTFGFFYFAVLSCSVVAAAKGRTQPIQLFDGKTFNGWTARDGQPVTKNWSIEDGTLALKDIGGSLFTKDEYGDFDLSFQWKLAAKGNSGVKYRVNFYEKGVFGRPGWLGCEYQIYDDASSKPTAQSRQPTKAVAHCTISIRRRPSTCCAPPANSTTRESLPAAIKSNSGSTASKSFLPRSAPRTGIIA
jgi:hypothetical protein